MRGSKPMDALRTLPERAFRLRARLIAVGLCAVCFAGLIGRLFWLQLCTGGWYTQRALGQQLRDTVVPADRGKIYSADGALLAANSSCWTLRASPREMPEGKLALAAKGLAEILELDEAKLLEKFNDRRANDCLLRYRVERETADAVRDFCAANGITGVRINQDSKRWYPQGEFLASVLGFTNVDNAGVSGLELEYNDTLTGQNGVVLTAVNAWGYTLAQSYETELVPVEGSGLRLTIDANIQHYLENALNYAVQEHHVAARSVGIVLEVNTGAIARGYRDDPYPTAELLGAWREMGGRTTITSDCHDAAKLDCAFDRAAELLRRTGYRTVLRLGTGEELWQEENL